MAPLGEPGGSLGLRLPTSGAVPMPRLGGSAGEGTSASARSTSAVWCDSPKSACITEAAAKRWWPRGALPARPGAPDPAPYVATHAFSVPDPLRYPPTRDFGSVLYFFPEDRPHRTMQWQEVHTSGALVVEAHVLRRGAGVASRPGDRTVEIHGQRAAVSVAEMRDEAVRMLEWYERHGDQVIQFLVFERAADRTEEQFVTFAQSLEFR